MAIRLYPIRKQRRIAMRLYYGGRYYFYTTRMHDEETEKGEIHGKHILYRREDERAYEYLRRLDHDEWDVIFEYAERHREAKFRDEHGREYLLIRQDHDDYVLQRR